jgi:ribulose-phosphate 3-epimerase
MSRPVRVVPAILTEDPQALKTMLQQAESFTDFVQIDIMDGQFVPSHSISWEQIAGIKTKIDWEVHLMVKKPEKQLEGFKQAGARKAVFHFEATAAPARVIAAVRKLGLAAGLAVNPETAVSKILPLADKVDSILFLSVHPGFYGAQFLPEVLAKVAELRQARPGIRIAIDGGIKESNIAQAARSGVDEICVGSAIFMQPDPGASYRKLLALARSKSSNPDI